MVGQPLLAVEDLEVTFETRRGAVTVLNHVSFEVNAGEILGIVGESGCGKSMTALAIMGLVPGPNGRISDGRILYRGEDLVQANEVRLRSVRGASIAMIFQEPMTSLNPVFTIGEQIAETLRLHEGLSRADARRRALQALDSVRIPAASTRFGAYAHELSGGMRQRVMIAIALACKPDLLIADEPTTALDVTVQAQIFDLLREIGRESGAGIMLITHDMGAVAEMADRVFVMYAGHGVESGPVDQVLAAPAHPYTQGLIACTPHVQMDAANADLRLPLAEIPGVVPSLHERPPGCPFAPRCAQRLASCYSAMPTALPVRNARTNDHAAACHLLAVTPPAAHARRPMGRSPC
ncbi:MAG: ABC transporter ATP-binding protein [Geminicoccaceae bacterium]